MGTYVVTITDNNGCTATKSFIITQPNATTVTSISRIGTTPANSGTVTYAVTFAASVSGVSASNFTLTTSGLTGASIDPALSNIGNVYTVTVHTGTGNGTLALNLNNSSGITPPVTNVPFTSGDVYTIDKTAPSVAIGNPSVSLTKAGPVSYTITYADANFNSSTLSATDVTLNKTGTAIATGVSVSGTGLTRTVQLTGITGNGTLGISLAAGTASDLAGNLAPASGPSAIFVVDNTAPTISISTPSVTTINTGSGPVTYTLTYADANFNTSTLSASDISLNTTGSATGTITVTGSGTTYTVSISNISGLGTLGISIAAGTATDNAGNSAPASSPSSTFTVTPISQNITFNPLPAKVYGDADFSPGATSDNNGIPITYSSDNTAVATIVSGKVHIVAVGTANIKASQAADATHSAANVVQGLTVSQASLTVTADSRSKVYGSADPVLTYQITSGALVGTDAFTGTLTRVAGEAVNTYAITQGTLVLNANYNLTYTGANLTITQKVLTVTANNQSKVYGTVNPPLTLTYNGFAGTDNASSLTTQPTAATVAVTGSPVNTYPITVSGGVTANYSFSYVPGSGSKRMVLNLLPFRLLRNSKASIRKSANASLSRSLRISSTLSLVLPAKRFNTLPSQCFSTHNLIGFTEKVYRFNGHLICSNSIILIFILHPVLSCPDRPLYYLRLFTRLQKRHDNSLRFTFHNFPQHRHEVRAYFQIIFISRISRGWRIQ
jgi:hypothetical protein